MALPNKDARPLNFEFYDNKMHKKIIIVLFLILITFLSCSSKKNEYWGKEINEKNIKSAFLDHRLWFPHEIEHIYLKSEEGLTSAWALMKSKIPKSKLACFFDKNGFMHVQEKVKPKSIDWDQPNWALPNEKASYYSQKLIRDSINPDHPWYFVIFVYDKNGKSEIYLSSLKSYN